MKTTSTLKDILQSEFINKGLNEFSSKNHIHAYEDKFQFIKKVMKYDDDTHEIVTRIFFGGYKFESELVDKFIKKLFVNKFFDREIKYQTVERFAMEVISVSITYENYINEIVLNLSKYILGNSENNTNGNSKNEDNNRSLSADLPQNNINMSLENDVLNFATTNDISKHLSKTENTSKNTSSQYNLNNLIVTKDLINDIVNAYDLSCFLQIW